MNAYRTDFRDTWRTRAPAINDLTDRLRPLGTQGYADVVYACSLTFFPSPWLAVEHTVYDAAFRALLQTTKRLREVRR